MSIKNTNTFFYFVTIFIFCMLGEFSCFVTHGGRTTGLYEEQASSVPLIIFLNYSIRLDRSTGEVEIQLINKTIAEGKLKINNAEPEISKPGDLMCISLDNKLEPADSMIVSDPLNITVESVDENNSLFKKEIARDSAQFSIRMQVNENISSIGIKKNTNSVGRNSYLLITKIR